jgi:hypothetical protein
MPAVNLHGTLEMNAGSTAQEESAYAPVMEVWSARMPEPAADRNHSLEERRGVEALKPGRMRASSTFSATASVPPSLTDVRKAV